MKVITYCNLKGGTAKTTSCLSMGAVLAERLEPTLLVDLDPQASLTISAGVQPATSSRRYLSEEIGLEDAITATSTEGLHLIPADRSLQRLAQNKPSAIARRLEALSVAAAERFTFVLIDAPPTASALSVGALLAADGTIAPVASGRGALEGLGDTIALIDQIGAAPLMAAFACRVDLRTSHDKELAEYLDDNLAPGLATYVRETVRVKEAEMEGVPLPVFDASATATEDYRKITDQLFPAR